MAIEPCFTYRLYDASNELIYVGITGNVSLRIGQHRSSKAWWSEVARIETDSHKSRTEAKSVETRVIRECSPRYNIHEHLVNRANRAKRRERKNKNRTPEMTYNVHITREGDAWLADVPSVAGAHTFARSLEGLAKSVREVVILMDDLPDDADVQLDFQFATDDEAVTAAERLRRDRQDIDSRMDDLIVETARLATILAGTYSVRDAAQMLGITPGRISQLTSAKG